MTIFNRAIADIFSHEDFLEDCLIGGIAYKCICSPIDNEVVYGDIGALDEVNFTLDLKLPLDRMPKQGDKVRFRDSNYKISNVTYDSANASIALHLQSLSKG